MEDNIINITTEVNFIWNIANKLRGPYKSDKYKDVIIPMVIIRRFECVLEKTKPAVLDLIKKNPQASAEQLIRVSGYDFYNISKLNLSELAHRSENIAVDFIDYINGFSGNVLDIINSLDFQKEVEKMNKCSRLPGVIKAFSELDLRPETVDNFKMGYILEDIIRRFSQNAEAGDHYTPREVIRLLVNILLVEGCHDLFEQDKSVKVLDMACGTGGMLSAAYDCIKKANQSVKVELFGQEINPESYAICLADMMIKGENICHIVLQDTMKKDAFAGQNMRFVLANPPFGQSWGGKDAGEGVEEAVRKEAAKGAHGRFGAGTPAIGDMQLLFFQHALNKLDNENGRAAIICNASPLFAGGINSGESQIRKWMLEHDYIEAIIALPSDLFYNTNIGIYAFIFSKNKSKKRKNKVQLINAKSENFWTPLKKSIGKKRKEITKEQMRNIVMLYSNFTENKYSKIFDKEEFMYREYTIYQPIRKNYAITKERIEKLQMDEFLSRCNKKTFHSIISILKENISDTVYKNRESFLKYLKELFCNIDKRVLKKIAEGLSQMDHTADIQRDRKGNIIWDLSTKNTELIKFTEDVSEYMKKEVLPYLPDAYWESENTANKKKPVVKTGAVFPFTQYFYEYHPPEKTENLAKEFIELEYEVHLKIKELFEGKDGNE